MSVAQQWADGQWDQGARPRAAGGPKGAREMDTTMREGARTASFTCWFPELQKCFWNDTQIWPLVEFPAWGIRGPCKLPCGSERWGACPAQTPSLGCTTSKSALSWFCLTTYISSGPQLTFHYYSVLRQKRGFLNSNRPSRGGTDISTTPHAASSSSGPLIPDMVDFPE